MALTDKEIEYLDSQLPEGMRVVDFRGVHDVNDFVKKYTNPIGGVSPGVLATPYNAIITFIEHVKTKK